MSKEKLAAIMDPKEIHAISAVVEYCMLASWSVGRAGLSLDVDSSTVQVISENAVVVYRQAKTELADMDELDMDAMLDAIVPIVGHALDTTLSSELGSDDPTVH